MSPLEVYQIVMCKDIDEHGGSASLIGVFDDAELDSALFGEDVPITVRVTLVGDGRYHVGLSWVGAGGTFVALDPAWLTLDGRTSLLRRGLRTPPKPGEYKLVVEWCRREGEPLRTGGAYLVMFCEVDAGKKRTLN